RRRYHARRAGVAGQPGRGELSHLDRPDLRCEGNGGDSGRVLAVRTARRAQGALSMSIRFLTAGDSHGDALLGIVEGVPAGVALDEARIARELSRRRIAYGRSSRQNIEEDVVRLSGGVWKGLTTGAPIGITIPNRARTVQGKTGGGMGTVPRPGHADFAGVMKYGFDEIPPVSERASARSTAMRVAIGAVAKA